jgi:rhomboid protease GluP
VNNAGDVQPSPGTYILPLHRPVATWVLLASIAVVFVTEELVGWSRTGSLGSSIDTEVLILLGAKVTPLVAAGQYWRLLTSVFLHIDIPHLLFNGYALIAIGRYLERLLGSGRFAAIYLLSGLFGSLASFAFSQSLSAGASGAIFGLIGALAAFFALHRKSLGAWGRSRLVYIGIWVVITLFWGLTQSNIDSLGHVGGLLSGLALGWALAPRYEIEPTAVRVVDQNRLARYYPALLVAVLLLVGGTVQASMVQRNSPRSHLLRAQEAIDREDWATVVSESEQALAGDPSLANVATYFYLGLGYNHLQQPALAVGPYEAALELESTHSPSLWNLAITRLELEHYAEARRLFERYVELNPAEVLEVRPYLEELRHLGY